MTDQKRFVRWRDDLEDFWGRRHPEKNLRRILLLCALLFGLALRLAGLYRGESVLRPGGEPRFYHFHPDEETILYATLHYGDPLTPPLTSYGTPPLYLLTAAMELVGLATGYGDWNLERTPAPLYRTARTLAALISCLTLWLLWLLGRRYFDPWTTAIALLFTAAPPMAVQQAHFYTIDGLFTLLNLLLLWAVLRALEGGEKRFFLLAGLLIGAASAARIVGLIGGLVLAGGYLYAEGWKPRRILRPHLWLAGLGALTTMRAFAPYRFMELLQDGSSNSGSHAISVSIALGETIRPWSLSDAHTIPYLHHWIDLFPTGAGWPLTLAFLAGAVTALRRRNRPAILLLSWCLLYFAAIGFLLTKPIRYLMPLLPLLSLLAANASVQLIRARRSIGIPLLAAVAIYTGAYGLACTRIYLEQDSRLRAAGWLAENAAADSRVGVEGGGFSLEKVIAGAGFQRKKLDVLPLFRAHGHALCAPSVRLLRAQVQSMDFIAIADVNRYLQFASAPEQYPLIARFYEKLVAGELGFAPVRRFKTCPHLFGLDFCDDTTDLAYIGFDHPAALLLRRDDQSQMARAWEEWEEEMRTDPRCPDGELHRAVAAFRAGRLDEALERVQEVLRLHPRLRVAHLLAAAVHERRGDAAAVHRSLENYRAPYARRAEYEGPRATAAGVLELGIADLFTWARSAAPR